MSEQSSVIKHFNKFIKRVCPLYLIDHAGRAGNGFFQTLFDGHPEVLSIPWIHYCTSYFVTEFAEEDLVDSRKAHEFWSTKSYFRFFYAELSEDDHNLVHRFGGDPETQIDRLKIRKTFDKIILRKNSVSRKEVIYASFYAIAEALGRDLDKIKFLILTDSISLRMESVLCGFSGKIIDQAIKDSPEARFIHLVRDPRAGFASTNHQFVNQLGNVYALRPSNIPQKFMELLRCQFSMEGPFVFGFLTLYFLETFRAIEEKKQASPERFLTIRNEDLNLQFVSTIKKLAEDLQVSFNRTWEDPDYCPTMLGKEWQGTGGYSNRYQTKRTGPLQNDPDEVSRNVVGPNAYVTQRWKKRLSQNEISLLDYFFRHEIQAYGYEFLRTKPFGNSEFFIWLKMALPFRGEIPHPIWLRRSKNWKEFMNRFSYYLALPAFYLIGRLTLLMNKKCRKILFHDHPKVCLYKK